MEVVKQEKVVLKTNEVAHKLGVCKDTALKLMKSPGFPSFSIGKLRMVTEDDFNDWLNSVRGKDWEV